MTLKSRATVLKWNILHLSMIIYEHSIDISIDILALAIIMINCKLNKLRRLSLFLFYSLHKRKHSLSCEKNLAHLKKSSCMIKI